MTDLRCDVAVVGAGLLGLATAADVLRRWPRLRVAVLEKEPRVGMHQSGRNSGVLHSGLYYAPGSLKARLCVQGARALVEFCQQRGLPLVRCGKLVVALDESELPRLEELHRRGLANGVPGLERVGPERMREIEPHAVGVRGLYSAETAVVDFAAVAGAYCEEVIVAGGQVLCGREVLDMRQRGDQVLMLTTGGAVESRFAIICAGLHADRLARMTGSGRDPRIVPFRGDYYRLRQDRSDLVRALIYPVPDPAFPFLGVHFTRRHDGEVWLGPNAVLAFAREGYRRQDFKPGEVWETLSYAGFWRLAARYWRVGAAEMYRDLRKAAFLAALRRYVPELRDDDVMPGPSGVRAQALDRRGRLVDDFVIEQSPRIIHVRNAPSPAATASLAIARYIADVAQECFGWEAGAPRRMG